MVKLPAFDETEFFDHRENLNSRVMTIPNAKETAFDAYCEMFETNGLVKREEYQKGEHRFAAFSDEKSGYFVNYFGSVGELMVVEEENCSYFSYGDESAPARVPPQLTQVKLEDYGMSYAIRLSDGRFIVIDGGRNFDPDADQLLTCLKDGSEGKKPAIAAWIMTHPHSDHYHCFLGFMERYAEEVVIEKFLLNFPEADDYAHYPKLAPKDPARPEQSETFYMRQMHEIIRKLGIPVYTPHTGQNYRIGDAICEILACMDDTIHRSQNINMTSLVIRMELGGQTILWGTDASFSDARLPEKYGEYLKADILQVPHHGFQCGEASAEIAGYRLIQPKVCLLPASDYTAYRFFCVHKAGARYLMTEADVEEIITGEEQRTLTLPYTAPASAKVQQKNKVSEGLASAGATTWVFSELSTACPEDFEFTILNTTVVPGRVWIELYFEDRTQRILFIEATAPKYALKKLCIVGEDVDPDTVYYNPFSLTKKGIPENVPFAVRFLSDVPVVISHKRHRPSYQA